MLVHYSIMIMLYRACFYQCNIFVQANAATVLFMNQSYQTTVSHPTSVPCFKQEGLSYSHSDSALFCHIIY